MPETIFGGLGEERRIKLTKMVGSGAAFILLVMWMTPPTTPHPMAPSPLERYRQMRSDAPTRDPLAGPGDYSAMASPVAWYDVRTPDMPRRRLSDAEIEGPEIVFPDDTPPARAAEPVYMARTDPDAIEQPYANRSEQAAPVQAEQPQSWASVNPKAFEDRADAPLEDER